MNSFTKLFISQNLVGTNQHTVEEISGTFFFSLWLVIKACTSYDRPRGAIGVTPLEIGAEGDAIFMAIYIALSVTGIVFDNSVPYL